MLPRVSLHDGFFLDTRQKGERKIVNSGWIPKDGKNPLRIEIADKNDLVLVANFFNHHFIKNNNLRKILGATYEDMEQFSYDRAALALKKPQSYLVFDKNKLVAAVLRTFYTRDEFCKIFNGELSHTNPSFLIKDDYAEDIRAKGYSLNASRIAVLNEACFSQIGKFLPPDVGILEFGIAVGVHPNYMRNGLNQYLIYESLKSSIDLKCNYRVGIAVSTAGYEVAKKTGMKELFCLPYKDFKENGIPIFGDIPDKCCYVVLGKNDDMLRILKNETTGKYSFSKSHL
uniref:N-acetyltransferase domain-containing protein n=1 Tax=Panagrolaimus sp. PS1159 TaxID=55785 RepID=A0AC35FTM6_9BILA